MPRDVLELCDGVDLLIHDAQHTAEEYVIKRTWGHCTVEYAIHRFSQSLPTVRTATPNPTPGSSPTGGSNSFTQGGGTSGTNEASTLYAGSAVSLLGFFVAALVL